MSVAFCEYQHASSYPYLSGDTWRFFADFRLVGKEKFRPVDVQVGDVVYVEYRALRRFGRDYLPKIKNRFILITPNCEEGTDNPQPGAFSYFLDYPQLAHWFVQNIDRDASERLIPLPIGLANQVWSHGQVRQVEEVLRKGIQERSSKLYMNFSVHTNPLVREPCFAYFSTRASKIGSPCSFATYLDDLSHTVFVVSPPGNGLDCHRTWEALLMGCYPIVMSSTLNPLYEDLPVVVVSSWDEVTEEFLQAKEEEFRGKTFCLEKLYAPYWYRKIFTLQQELRKKPTWMERFRSILR